MSIGNGEETLSLVLYNIVNQNVSTVLIPELCNFTETVVWRSLFSDKTAVFYNLFSDFSKQTQLEISL